MPAVPGPRTRVRGYVEHASISQRVFIVMGSFAFSARRCVRKPFLCQLPSKFITSCCCIGYGFPGHVIDQTKCWTFEKPSHLPRYQQIADAAGALLFPLERCARWQMTHGTGNVPICQSQPADALLDVHLVGNTCSVQTIGQGFGTI